MHLELSDDLVGDAPLGEALGKAVSRRRLPPPPPPEQTIIIMP